MIGPELTEERIADAMARAEKVACSPGDDRCYPLPYSANEARKTCTPKGRCTIGGTRRVIVANAGRDSRDVWLDGQRPEVTRRGAFAASDVVRRDIPEINPSAAPRRKGDEQGIDGDERDERH